MVGCSSLIESVTLSERFCQLVEAETLNGHKDSLPGSSLSLRQPTSVDNLIVVVRNYCIPSPLVINGISSLQPKLRNREGHEARRVGLKAIPLDQDMEGGHGERQARLKNAQPRSDAKRNSICLKGRHCPSPLPLPAGEGAKLALVTSPAYRGEYGVRRRME